MRWYELMAEWLLPGLYDDDRLLRDLRQRAEWTEEARRAPTVAEWTERLAKRRRAGGG